MIQWAFFKKIEAKGGRSVKKWEFGQTEKKLYQFFKTRIYAFMNYGQFLPKRRSSWRFVIKIQGFEAFKAFDIIHTKASKGNIIGNRIQF